VDRTCSGRAEVKDRAIAPAAVDPPRNQVEADWSIRRAFCMIGFPPNRAPAGHRHLDASARTAYYSPSCPFS
jgi:hypothetical protein